MSKNMTNVGTRSSAIAIAQEGSELRAVKVERKGEAVEVLWAKSGEVKDGDWRSFVGECGLPTESTGHRRSRGGRLTVVGFRSTGVGFYRVGLPAAKRDEIPAMVRLQAETLLPLPAEQMEMSWRAGQVKNGEMPVTIAAARREPLAGFLEHVSCFEPESIFLDCEGVVKAWRALFSGNARPAVVVSLAERSTQVCLAEDGRLSNAVVLDMGTEDFCESDRNALLAADSEMLEETVAAERFAQDMRSVLESFGYGDTGLPIYVLSDGSSAIESIVSYLGSSGLNVRAVLPETSKLGGQVELGTEEAYRYRVPIGLALMALDDDMAGLNIFERVYNPEAGEEKRSILYSPKLAVAIAGIMLLVLVIVSYALDVKSEKHLGALQAQAGFKGAVERQMLIKAVARQRPDLLELLNEINAGDENKGVLLDSFHFKKGQPVTIRGQVGDNDKLYKFQENLLTKKGIKDVDILSAAPDSKTKKIKFTMTFHYKTYTKTSGRR